MKMKNYRYYKHVHITSYSHLLLRSFLLLSGSKALVGECRVSDPRGVAENGSQGVHSSCEVFGCEVFGRKFSYSTHHHHLILLLLDVTVTHWLLKSLQSGLDRISSDRFSNLVIIKITQKVFEKYRFSSLPLECSNSVSLRRARPDFETIPLDYIWKQHTKHIKTHKYTY